MLGRWPRPQRTHTIRGSRPRVGPPPGSFRRLRIARQERWSIARSQNRIAVPQMLFGPVHRTRSHTNRLRQGGILGRSPASVNMSHFGSTTPPLVPLPPGEGSPPAPTVPVGGSNAPVRATVRATHGELRGLQSLALPRVARDWPGTPPRPLHTEPQGRTEHAPPRTVNPLEQASVGLNPSFNPLLNWNWVGGRSSTSGILLRGFRTRGPRGAEQLASILRGGNRVQSPCAFPLSPDPPASSVPGLCGALSRSGFTRSPGTPISRAAGTSGPGTEGRGG